MAKHKQTGDGVYSTMPPRQRPGKSYPGGKHLRKAHERLERRHHAFSGKPGCRMPGSMTK